jgi:hypothetical protein
MTELEPREDDWARGVFDRARTGHHEPPWIPDATAAAERSNRHRRRRSLTAGALSTVAVIGLSTTAYATLGGGGGGGADGRPVTAAPGATTPVSRAASTPSAPAGTPATTAHTAPSTQSSQNPTTNTTQPAVDLANLRKYFQLTGGARNAKPYQGAPRAHDIPWSAAGLTTIGAAAQGLDPGLAHLRWFSAQPPDRTVVGLPAGTQQNEIDASSFWTPDGDLSRLGTEGGHPTVPFGYVTISTTSPVALNDGKPAGPCGIPDHAFDRSMTGIPTAWSPCEKHPLSDGSVVISAHALNLSGGGTVTIAAREFAGGAVVLVTATSYVVYDTPYEGGFGLSGRWTAQAPDSIASPNVAPVPWTDDSLVAALSAPGVTALP